MDFKVDPAQVSREMKLAKDANGRSLFAPEEWRTAEQITSFSQDFQPYNEKRKQKKMGQKKPTKKFQRKTLKHWNPKLPLMVYAEQYFKARLFESQLT